MPTVVRSNTGRWPGRLLTASHEVRARPDLRFLQLLDVQLSALVLIQSLEFSFHESHELLLRDLSILVLVHEEHQLLDIVLSQRDLVLWRSGSASGYGNPCPRSP